MARKMCSVEMYSSLRRLASSLARSIIRLTLYFLFFTAAGKPYRAFAWAYVLLYIFFYIQTAKFYWLSPAYPALFAGGAYGLELLIRQRPRLSWMQPAYVWTLLISGLLMVPFFIPILPPETFIQTSSLIGRINYIQTENLTSSALPQYSAARSAR